MPSKNKPAGKKTVLMISPFASPNIGGVESYLDKLMNFLSKKNVRVFLITYKPLTTKQKCPAFQICCGGAHVHRMPWFGYNWFPKIEKCFPLVFIYLFPGIMLRAAVFYFRRHREVDVIHAHGFIAAAVARILTKIISKRAVVSTHAVYSLRGRWPLKGLIKWLLQDVEKIIAIGEPSKKELISTGLREDKVLIGRNWIDVDFFCPYDKIESKKSLGINTENLTVLFLGRLIPKKGVLLLLEAAKLLKQGVDFVFCGDGPLDADIRSASSGHKNIIFAGRLDFGLLPRYYSAADIFVSLALYDEGAAAVYLESISCGTPVIASHYGCPSYFLNEEVAQFIEPDIDSLIEKIRYWQANRDKLLNISKICRLYALENFSDKNAEIIAGSYDMNITNT